MQVLEISSGDRKRINEFIDLPFRLYRGDPCWVPPFRSDMRRILRRRHPFFGHSRAAFFLARRQGRVLGRITVFENRRLNSVRERATSSRFAGYYVTVAHVVSLVSRSFVPPLSMSCWREAMPVMGCWTHSGPHSGPARSSGLA